MIQFHSIAATNFQTKRKLRFPWCESVLLRNFCFSVFSLPFNEFRMVQLAAQGFLLFFIFVVKKQPNKTTLIIKKDKSNLVSFCLFCSALSSQRLVQLKTKGNKLKKKETKKNKKRFRIGQSSKGASLNR